MARPLGVILAGGLSRRMGGGDKCLLTLVGKPLLGHVMDRLTPQVAGVVLNANGDGTRFAEFDLPVVADSVEGFAGPLAGVLAGMDYAAEIGADQIVTVAADTPFFPRDLVVHLAAANGPDPQTIAMAATKDRDRGVLRHPTFALWPVALREDLRHALGEGLRKVVAWTDRHPGAEVVFQSGPVDPFFNVNTPRDMARAQELIRERGI